MLLAQVGFVVASFTTWLNLCFGVAPCWASVDW